MAEPLPNRGVDVSPSSEAPARAVRKLPRLGFELVVVFVGVWGALLAENARERRQQRQTAIRIAETVVNDLDSTFYGWAIPFVDSVTGEMTAWTEAYERGEKPIPYFFRVPGAEEGVGEELWDATVAAGLVEVFDPEAVRLIGRFYKENGGMMRRIGRYHAATEQVLFPGLAEGADYYYKSGTAELRPEVAGHMYMTAELIREWKDRVAWAPPLRDLLIAEIANRD